MQPGWPCRRSSQSQRIRHRETGMIAGGPERPQASCVQVWDVQLVKRQRSCRCGIDFTVLELNQVLAERVEKCRLAFREVNG